ncbi:MAG: cobalamin-independent methionine synthase II family protein [Xanthobacteraceae bacterium]
MKSSQQRILTTHVGSLPRSSAVVELLEAREKRAAFDNARFDLTVRQAVLDIVKRQVDAGIDIVSDGEASKISYATYVHDRLSGFSEEGNPGPPKPHLDVAPFPDFRRRMAQFTGAQRFKRVTCVGPIKVQNRVILARDLANMRAAVDAVGPIEAFLTAASPGVVASFLPNRYYPSHEAYIEAVADAMREEYAAIVAAGFILQLDCPDLAMSRHTGFQDLTEAEFLKRAAFHVEALNHALADVPADRVRMHVCWGNYEGPHTHDIDLSKIVRIVLGAKVQGIALEAANPRHAHEWTVWNEIALPDDKLLIPGVIDTSTNYVEHPALVAERIIRFADIVGRERVIAGTDCGFGTAAGSGKLDAEMVHLKLGTLVAGAVQARERLWR